MTCIAVTKVYALSLTQRLRQIHYSELRNLALMTERRGVLEMASYHDYEMAEMDRLVVAKLVSTRGMETLRNEMERRYVACHSYNRALIRDRPSEKLPRLVFWHGQQD